MLQANFGDGFLLGLSYPSKEVKHKIVTTKNVIEVNSALVPFML